MKLQNMPGVTVSVSGLCTGCEECTRGVCFVDAICLEEKQAVIDPDLCRGCGRCVSICPNEAIEITLDDQSYISRSIEMLEGKVDVT